MPPQLNTRHLLRLTILYSRTLCERILSHASTLHVCSSVLLDYVQHLSRLGVWCVCINLHDAPPPVVSADTELRVWLCVAYV
jgi:hypothetical protein